MLRRLEHQLSAFSATVRTGIGALEERTGEAMEPAYAQDEAEPVARRGFE
jgi:hypothetical protein